MTTDKYFFTSESVSEGHPDKICDLISDTVLDAHLEKLPDARVACETLVTTDRVVIAGEVRGSDEVDETVVERLARETIREIGYAQTGFHWQTANVEVLLHKQSADIALGVDARDNKDEGAGDQGIMFGFACRETPELMPAPILYAHRILEVMADARHKGLEPALGPDAKSQVTVKYEQGKPTGIAAVVVSTQHVDEELSSDDVRGIVEPYVLQALPDDWVNGETVWHVNPTGKFVIGGPVSDAGLTGRKIIVDTYGGAAHHGGGAFSGKDPTKVDRSAAYAARYLAKNIVAADLTDRCLIQLAYAIGVAEPVSIYLDLGDNAKVPANALEAAIRKTMDLTPRGIREHLELNKPIYKRTAAYGHFGRQPDADGGFSWERTDLAEALTSAL